ncbi:hypothetical protein ACQ4PT_024277 [Festuca glaucescens]
MTVGSGSGDLGGDLATPSQARDRRRVSEADGSPEWLRGSRFWLLQPSDDEEEGVDEEASPGVEDYDLSFRYLCRTPSPVSGRDIVDDSQELAQRTLKRIKKREEQRVATKAAMALELSEGTSSCSSRPLGYSAANFKAHAMPVMEPSVFYDDNNGGWTVVRRRRRSPVITGTDHDPKNKENSKSLDLGLARLRASPNKTLVRWNPLTARKRTLIGAPSDGDRGPRQVKVGADVAGRAFRNLLGLSWRNIETGEPVVRRHDRSIAMDGDGGRGGFNPGRGGFNAGRGGYQGCGGYQAHGGYQGRGAFQGRGMAAPRGRQNMAAGRQNCGGGQGGHRFDANRGFQGNADYHPSMGGNSNYVQGETSAAGASNYANQQQHWAGNFQRSSGYNSGNSSGYGGNQQRWNADRGFQYRARENGANMQPRSGIDADLLQQIVQAVVAAVTAATKVAEPIQSTPTAANIDIVAGGKDQHVMTPVAAPNVVPQPAQVVQENQDAGAKGKDNEGQGPQKKKKEEKSGCFRCKQPGHYIDDCPTPFCDLCESVHHATHACHLHQAPKPTAILHGYANEALMFFELACGAFKAKVDNPKLAKVTVDGDAMTIPNLIDQLKKIVPSDKFNWEVFHFKDNIYRVKFPSKQEVQRLKNFGTYICTDRESCLSFDLWSSLEEPMYTLPEVWVRVSGLPSDIRTDYLSLWGVGTLFGKTLDVDMAYTRRNKLHFEVEDANGSQEVDMAEVNNDDGGNDDAHNGEHNKEGGNAMDMDPKGLDEGDTSNKDKQDGEVNINGIQGMQLHAHYLDEIKIGSINVQLSPKALITMQIWCPGNQPRDCPSGQQGQLTGNNGSSQRARDTFKRAAKYAVRAGSGVAARDAVVVETMTCSAQKITGPWAPCEHMHAQRTTDGAAGLPLVDTRLPLSPSVPKADGTGQGAGHAGQLSADSVQQAQQLATCTDAGDAGFSAAAAAVGGKRGGILWPQTIQGEQEPALPADQVDRGNDGVIMATDRPMIGMHCSDLLGSSVHQKNAAKGTTSISVMVDSLDQPKDGIRTRGIKKR